VSENLGGIHPDMRVQFRDQPIFSLTKVTFSLRNTGAAAVKAQDVVEPIRLKFPAAARLLSALVEKTSPSDLKFSVKAVPDSGEVVLDFPLFNSNDEAVFSVYIFNSEMQRPTLEGRVVDVPQMIYSEANVSAAGQHPWPLQGRATRSVLRWPLMVLYGGLAALFTGIWVSGIVSYVSYLPWKWRWADSYKAFCDEWNSTQKEKAKALKKEGTNAPPVEQDQYEMRHVDELGRIYSRHEMIASGLPFLRGSRFDKDLKEKGIPDHPHPMVESFAGLVGLSVFMAVLASTALFTMLIVHGALKN